MTERTRLLSTLVALSLASPAAHAEPMSHTPAQHEGIVRVTGVVATPTTHDDASELRALQARIRAAKAKRALERARTSAAKSQAAADRAVARARASAAKLADLESRAAK